jgi:hypothetical protein
MLWPPPAPLFGSTTERGEAHELAYTAARGSGSVMALPVERPMSSDEFETLLVEIRDGVQATLTDFADEGAEHDPKIEDARAVWRTAEFALAMLSPSRYVPEREALEEATELLDRLGETKDTGGEG